MRRIILILLFVFIASLSLAKDLDLSYEIKDDQYVINKYVMDYDERETVKVVVVAGVLIVLVVLLVILTVDMVSEPDPYP